jgi:hypothetical protein
VYCFLSRRGGDSEELITGRPKTPKIKAKIWLLFRALETGWGAIFRRKES